MAGGENNYAEFAISAPHVEFHALIALGGHHAREPVICRTCGYNLTGNESGICPECGQHLHISQILHIAKQSATTAPPPK